MMRTKCGTHDLQVLSYFTKPLKVGRSLDEGQDEFVGHGCLVGYVCPVLTDPGYGILLTTVSAALPRAMTSDFRSNHSWVQR